MPETQSPSVGNRLSAREFLLSRMMPDDSPGTAAQKSSVGLMAFYREYPHVLMGGAFADGLRTRMEQIDRFALLAVRIDRLTPKKGVSSERYAAELLLDVAWAIDACCREVKGLWGLLDRRNFGSFLPDRGAGGGRELATRIQEKLAGLRQETVSIGIAVHPLAHFHRRDIFQNVQKALRHARILGPGGMAVFDAVSLNISGDRCYDDGDIQGAVAEFQTALSLDPGNLNVRNSLGVCYGHLNRFDEALAVFREALVLDPKEPMTFYNAGRVCLMRQDRRRALRYLLQADALNDGFFEAALQIGRLYLEAGETEKGRPFLEKAARIRPAPGVVHRYLGDCYRRSGLFKEALRAYKKALKHNPADATALSAIGHLFDVMGESLDIAVLICENSVEIAPDSGVCRYRLGRLYLKQHRPDDALQEFLLASESGYDVTPYIERIHRRGTAKAG